MTEKDNLRLILVWNAAIPLSRAALHFAPEDMRKEWAELAKVSVLDSSAQEVQSNATRGASWFDMIGLALKGANTALAPRNKLLQTAQTLLLEHIKKGHLIGLGYEPPRLVKSVPVHIPPQLWHGAVSWDSSEVFFQSLKFIEVRLITPAAAKPIFQRIDDEAQAQAATLPPAPGRPSIQHHVLAAFKALDEAGQINIEKSARSHYPIVRQWVSKNTSCEADRLSDEGIRSHFSPLFKELQKSRKQ